MKSTHEYAEQFLADSTQLYRIMSELIEEVGKIKGSRDVTADEFAEILHTQSVKWQDFAMIVNRLGEHSIDPFLFHKLAVMTLAASLTMSAPKRQEAKPMLHHPICPS